MHQNHIANLRLKLRHGYLDREAVAELLNDVIRGREQDDELRRLARQVALDLRPTLDSASAGEPSWKHWVAMSMRQVSIGRRVRRWGITPRPGVGIVR